MILRPLDLARVHVLHALGPVSRALVVSRERRVAVSAVLAAFTALALAAGAPMWAIAVSPLVFGVPHVVADVRYLVVRTGLGRERRLLLALALPLLATAFIGLRAGTIAAAIALLGGSRRRGWIGLALLAPVAAIAWHAPARADAVFAHLHNLVAVLLWWAWRPRGERAGLRLVGLGAVVAGAALIAAGAFDGSFAALGHPRGFDPDSLARALAPGMAAPWARRLLALYAFGQAVHYAVWLRLVPDEDRERATPRSFRASWRALAADVGPVVLAGAIVALVFFAAWGVFDASRAQGAYLRSASFHGHLEIVALAYAFARGRLRP